MACESVPLILQTLGTIATAVAAIAAWRAANEAGATVRDARARRVEERQQTQLAASTEAFWRLTKRWDDMSGTRTAAGRVVQEVGFDDLTKCPSVDAVLDFLDAIALLIERQAVDRALVSRFFAEAVVFWWSTADPYVASVRTQRPNRWRAVEILAMALRRDVPDHEDIFEIRRQEYIKHEASW